jgi:hypothetical protein
LTVGITPTQQRMSSIRAEKEETSVRALTVEMESARVTLATQRESARAVQVERTDRWRRRAAAVAAARACIPTRAACRAASSRATKGATKGTVSGGSTIGTSSGTQDYPGSIETSTSSASIHAAEDALVAPLPSMLMAMEKWQQRREEEVQFGWGREGRGGTQAGHSKHKGRQRRKGAS